MIKGATASYSQEEMHGALEVNLPNYPSAIVTTDEIVGALASPFGANLADESLPQPCSVLLWVRSDACGSRCLERDGDFQAGWISIPADHRTVACVDAGLHDR